MAISHFCKMYFMIAIVVLMMKTAENVLMDGLKKKCIFNFCLTTDIDFNWISIVVSSKNKQKRIIIEFTNFHKSMKKRFKYIESAFSTIANG